MGRISPIFVLLLAAGCANAGIGDWLNPFRVFQGKPPHGAAASPASGGPQHSPKSGGRGEGGRPPRQLYANPHHTVPSPNLGSPPGHLDDGFKPSFPPGFANPPSHSPNLNPFATVAGQGSESNAKGPFLPEQLTVYHTPNAPPHKPLAAPPTLPNLNRGRGGRGPFGGRGRGPRGPPPHAAVAEASNHPESPVGPDGSPVHDFPGLGSSLEPNHQQPEYEETPTSPPSGPSHAPGGRGPPRGSFFRPGRGLFGRGRPSRPPPSHHQQQHNQGGQHGGHNPYHGGPPSGPGSFNSGPPSGPPEGHSFLESGPDSQGPFSRPNGPPGPRGPGGPGGPGPLGSNPLSGGPQGSRPDSNVFFASSPGSNSPFGLIPDQGPQGPSPFSGSEPSYGGPNGPQSGPQSLFGPNESGPRGPPPGQEGGPGGRPGGSFGGPQSFLNTHGSDYPEQYQGGPRGPREPSQIDFRPQFGGPESQGNEEQNPGFYGALHNSDSPQQLGSFFSGGEQGGPGGPPSYDGPQGGPGGPQGFDGSQGGPSSSIFGGGNQGQGSPAIYGNGENGPAGAYSGRPRKPPVRFNLRNPLAAFSHNVPVSLPVPKASRLLRPFVKKPGVIPLSSPRDPNFRPMRLGASSLSPVAAPYEPDTAASGGYHGGYGDVGLSHNGDRILYHVAGHQGPYSYQFGFDTGKGYNRIFRFEEKDGKGFVKGKYGFYDKTGKLNIINYMAHPKHGYHAERGHSHGLY